MMKDQLIAIVQTKKFELALAAVSAFAAGVAAGTSISTRQLEKKYETTLKWEIEQTKEFYSQLYKTDEYETPESAAAALGVDVPTMEDAVRALTEYQGKPITGNEILAMIKENDNDEEPEVAAKNIFVDGVPIDDTFDYAEELENRTEDSPYVISQEEFLESEPGYTQVVMTYYEGDDTLAGEDDGIVDDLDIVGVGNLQKFGHGSRDNNVVYVRNDLADLDMEIHRNKSKYAEKVLGFIQHSDRPTLRRFRGDDE